MGGYGTHPTRYGSLSDGALYSMYREAVYSRLTEAEKLELLQETVNRDALERGELGSPRVQFSDLPSHISGNAGDGVININRSMAVDGVWSIQYNGDTIQRAIDDYNIQTLNTVLHENVHCFQNQVIDGTIQIKDAQLAAEYQANHFTESAVLLDHSYHMGSQYLTGETPGGYYLYYFQATERDAYLEAEKKTESILQEITARYGPEASFAAYAKSMAAAGYGVKEREAVQLFQNPDFVKDLNQTLQNQRFGTAKPVNPATEKAVKAEMIETYRAMQLQINGEKPSVEKEEARMNNEHSPVTLEAYNQSPETFGAAAAKPEAAEAVQEGQDLETSHELAAEPGVGPEPGEESGPGSGTDLSEDGEGLDGGEDLDP